MEKVLHPCFAQYREKITKVAQHEKDFDIPTTTIATVLKNKYNIISNFSFQSRHEATVQ